MKHLVIDTDGGSDDAAALLLLLKAQEEQRLCIVGITIVHGNTSVYNAARNVMLVLESVGRSSIPIYLGAQESLTKESVVTSVFHGADGFGDLNLPPPNCRPQEENAIVALNRMACQYKGLSLHCLGPLTNIALAIKTYPDFSSNIGEMYLMGGNTKGIGNVNDNAEFNFFVDPEAAHIVMSVCRCPITMLPWEPCIPEVITMQWRLKELGSRRIKHMDLLTAVDASVYSKYEAWQPCDAYLAACYLNKNMIKQTVSLNVKVELHRPAFRGLTMVSTDTSNVNVIDELDFDVFKQMMIEVRDWTPQ